MTKSITKSVIFRYIVELSSMSNNDEVVFHAPFEMTFEQFDESDIKRKLTRSSWDHPKLVVCRPVLENEIVDGLDTTFNGDAFDEKAPESTILLDGLVKVVDSVKWAMKVYREERRNPTDIVTHIIASDFYDCMSGGMPTGSLLACRAIVKHFDCDLSKPVYPGKIRGSDEPDDGSYKTWYTLGDWMEETKNAEKGNVLPEGLVTRLLTEGVK